MAPPPPKVDLAERIEVLCAALHNVESRLLACIPDTGMQSRANELERIGREFIARAERMRQGIASDTASLATLLEEREMLRVEIELCRVAIQRRMTIDYSVIRNAVQRVRRERQG